MMACEQERTRVSTRLLLFRNWLGNPKFWVCQLLGFVFDHVSQHDGPFQFLYSTALFQHLNSILPVPGTGSKT